MIFDVFLMLVVGEVVRHRVMTKALRRRLDDHAVRLQRLERRESVEAGPVDPDEWAPVVPMDRRTS